MHANPFYNTKLLLWTLFKKDVVKLSIWVFAISGFVVGVSHAYPALFPNPEELTGLAKAMQNPVMVAMFGPVYDPSHYTTAQALGNQMLLFSMLFSALMSIFIVSRYTRGDEEEGVLELIQSLPVGRLSHTLASLIIVVVMNTALFILIGLGLALVPDESITWTGSLTFGLSIGTTGILIASMTVLIAQLFENNRTVMGVSFLVLGFMYILRGYGDLSDNIFKWLVPLNWPARVEVYIRNLNLFNLYTLLLAMVIGVIALFLNARRDLESGFMPQRKGRTHASKALKTPFGFVLRLLRPSLIAWAITVFILGATYGSVFGDLDAFIEGSDIFDTMLPGGDVELNVQFMSVVMMVVAITAGIGPIMFFNRLASEETKNHSEHIYSKNVSRTSMMMMYLLVSVICSVVFLSLGALGMLTGMMVSMETPIQAGLIFQAAFAYLPALMVMIGLSAFLLGFYPNKTNAIWVYFGYAFFSVYMGDLIGLPTMFKRLTPFGYVDQLPIESLNLLSVFGMFFIALLMMIVGFTGYNRRDLKG